MGERCTIPITEHARRRRPCARLRVEAHARRLRAANVTREASCVFVLCAEATFVHVVGGCVECICDFLHSGTNEGRPVGRFSRTLRIQPDSTIQGRATRRLGR